MDSTDAVSLSDVQGAPMGDLFAGYATFFWYLYRRNQYTDVVFDLKGPEGPVTLSAHKMVMSMWSPYLADKFYGEDGVTKTAINIIKLQDISLEAFKAMIRFMYGHSVGDLDQSKACNLYKLAIKFQVQPLVKLCLEYLNAVALDVSNVFDILEASKYMRNEGLVNRCHEFLQNHTKEVLEWYEPTAISPSMLHTLLDLPKLRLPSEFELLLWILAWGKNHFLQNSDYGCTRDALEKFLPKIQLLSLSNEEFAMIYRHHDDTFTKDEALSIFMNIGCPGSTDLPSWYDAGRSVRQFI